MAGPDDAIVMQFESDYDHLFQQQVSRLLPYVRVKTGITGNMTAFGLLGESAVTDITGSRHGTTDWHDSPSYRRWAVKRDYQDAQMLDEEDRLEILVDLEMGYAQNSAMAMSRKMDEVIIDAVTATAVSGATGTGTSTYDTTAPTSSGGGGNQIAASGTGLTPDKMREALAILGAREAGLDDMLRGTSPYVWVTNPRGHQQLMAFTEATTTDYLGVEIRNGQEASSRMPLVSGRIPFYMGFRILVSNHLNLSGSDYVNVAWHNKAMALAVWGGRRVWVGDLPEHNLARGILVKEHFGSVRVHDRGVLSVLCNP